MTKRKITGLLAIVTTTLGCLDPSQRSAAPVAHVDPEPSAPWSPPHVTPLLAVAPGAHAPSFWMPIPPVPLPPNMDPVQPTSATLASVLEAMPTSSGSWVTQARLLAETCRAEEIDAGNRAASSQSKEGYAAARKYEQAARSCVIETYVRIVTNKPAIADADADLVALASEHGSRRIFDANDASLAESEDVTAAIECWRDLIKRFPKSRFMPAALRVAGDYFLREALARGSEFEMARAAFFRELSEPAEAVEVAYAHLRLGYIAWNMNDATRAKINLDDALGAADRAEGAPHVKEIVDDVKAALAALPP